MTEQMLRAFAEEVAEIQKEAGVGSFLAKGFKGLGSAVSGARRVGAGTALKRHGGAIKGLWQKGGLKALGKSGYGSMAAATGVGGLAAYGGYKALGGGRQRQQQGYR